MNSHRAYRGTFIQAPSLGKLEILEDHRLVVNQHGFIVTFDRADNFTEITWSEETVIPKGSFVLPTFCDLHLHAPQYLYQGNGLDLPLMQWLDTYILKSEEQLDSDHNLARKVYRKLARRLLTNGTGAVLLFGTIKEDTNLILAEEMQNAGIRAFVGKLSMDISSRPTYVEASAEASLNSAKSFVSRCRDLVQDLQPHERLVEPVLTPRFVPTCSNVLLQGLGVLSNTENLKIQSHLAEAQDQVDWVRKERGKEDIDVFAEHNLLTPRTIQAHCTYLSPPDLSRICGYDTAIAHCPLSNIYFSAEPFRLREALNRNVKVGLGTDIAGGYSVDIMSAMRQAVAVSRMRQGTETTRKVSLDKPVQDDNGTKEGDLAIDWKESVYLATTGGAISLGLGHGLFKAGAPFDAQRITLQSPSTGEGIGAIDFFEDISPSTVTEEMVEKWWCIGDDRNRIPVMVDLRRIAFVSLTAVVLFGTGYSVLYNTYLDTSNPILSNLPHPLSHSHYFANKSNPLNVYFIKKAWGWTTGLFLLLWVTSTPQKRTARRLAQWAVATGVWLLFTMWFFGPSILDRVIVASGGACMVRLPSGELATLPTEACFAGAAIGPTSHPHFFSQISQVSTQAADWKALPRLRRGHDVSGHIFLLTMSTLFLADQLRSSQCLAPWSLAHRISVFANIALIGIWMLASYTTSVYFHSPFEKLSQVTPSASHGLDGICDDANIRL
ncbi:hypothetical protein NP233_g6983 [Leucocoprinus birnbaumii]|uniref:Amidohydrolase-related domain-containing protein n=1 Tax=Leucocoprinus birnbaumii TaxID=56174 RepID=A0AAD5YV81_9AGAR|nr:hypothetical protein NP233_g6983 [Leucocoprinus birnbaumii]